VQTPVSKRVTRTSGVLPISARTAGSELVLMASPFESGTPS
jgi:hypothetical protein